MVVFFNMLIAVGTAVLAFIAIVRVKQWGYQHGYFQLPTTVYYSSSDDEDDDRFGPMLMNPETGLMMTEYGVDSGGNPYGVNLSDNSASSSSLFDDDNSTCSCPLFEDSTTMGSCSLFDDD